MNPSFILFCTCALLIVFVKKIAETSNQTLEVTNVSIVLLLYAKTKHERQIKMKEKEKRNEERKKIHV